MRSRRNLFSALVAAILLLVATVQPGHAEYGDVLARYVIVAHDPIADKTTTLARAIMEGTDVACPAFHQLDSDGVALGALNSTTRINPDEEAFPVTVCEAVVPAGARASVGGLPLPTLIAEPEHLVIIGDSGCFGGDAQDCQKAWPFPGIASHAAERKPDLVIHVGDWNYRGTPSTKVDGEATYNSCLPRPGRPWVNTTSGDTWQTWWQDVFQPAATLMITAPWVVLRGNHELCSRAGRGWFYLLDPHSVLLDPYRALPVCNALTVRTEAYALDIGHIRLVVMDSANACDDADFEDVASLAYQARYYARQFDHVAALARGSAKPVWLLVHHPVWSATHYTSEPGIVSLNATLQRALKQSLASSLPPSVSLVLSGHVHEFQAITFDHDRPPQLIVGNSGVALDSNLLDNPYSVEVDGEPATGLALSARTGADSFGYLDVTLAANGVMTGKLHGFQPDGRATGRVVAVCSLPVGWNGLCRLGP